MNVLLVVGPATGGMGAHVASLAAGLPARGVPVTVFTDRLTADRFHLGSGEPGSGERVVTGWRPGPAGPAAVVRSLRRLLPAADVVHAHGHQAGLLTVLAAATLPRRRRPAVVVSWHNAVLAGGPAGRLLALAERLQARRADLLTGASDDLVERAARLGARSPELAEVAAPATTRSIAPADPTDPATYPAADRNVGRRARAPVVLTVSRIAAQKRLDVVVDAAAALGARVPGLAWRVAGDGDPALLARLRARAAERAAPVEFLGARADVPRLLAGADVFALASAWEARALVVQEAMAAGVPVVAPAVGGLPGLLAGTGLLVPPGDADALAGAVGRLLADPDLAARLAAAAGQRFAELPTEADVVLRWSERYRALTR